MTPNITRHLRADRKRVGIQVYQAFVEEWELDAKFCLIASQLRAEPLGLCRLVPEVEYQIVHIRHVSVHVRRNDNTSYVLPKNYVGMVTSPDVITYVLPKAYTHMLSQTDMNKINSGQRRYTIVRAVHECGLDRIHFDHKNYTWDLKLVRI